MTHEYMSSANVTEHFLGAQNDSAENASSLYLFLGTAAVFGLLAVRYVSSLLSPNNQVTTAVEEVEAAFEKVLADLKERGKKEAAAEVTKTENQEVVTASEEVEATVEDKETSSLLDTAENTKEKGSIYTSLFDDNTSSPRKAFNKVLEAIEERGKKEVATAPEDNKDNQLLASRKMLVSSPVRNILGALAGAGVAAVIVLTAGAAIPVLVIAILASAVVSALLPEAGCAVSSWAQKAQETGKGTGPDPAPGM